MSVMHVSVMRSINMVSIMNLCVVWGSIVNLMYICMVWSGNVVGIMQVGVVRHSMMSVVCRDMMGIMNISVVRCHNIVSIVQISVMWSSVMNISVVDIGVMRSCMVYIVGDRVMNSCLWVDNCSVVDVCMMRG